MERKIIRQLAKKIWDYHRLNQKPEKSDCILVLGSHDLRVAARGAELFLAGYAPLIVFSGGLGHLTKGLWSKAEADKFAAIALKMGVPKESMLLENRSTNTGENILFTKKLLAEKGIAPKRILLVQKPYMERRTYATFKKLWPEQEFLVTSPQLSFEDYPSSKIPEDFFIGVMVGDLQRIKKYSEKGFQIAQEIPADIWQAYEQLVAAGYTEHLIRD